MGAVQAKGDLSGFGLIEALIAISIMALVALITIPQFIEYLQNRRLSNSLVEFQSAITLARSEAIRRNTGVRLSSINGNQNNLWGNGWRVWIDLNNNQQFDPGADELLLSKDILPTGITATHPGGISTLEFSGTGFIRNFTPDNNATQTLDIKFCSNNLADTVSIGKNGMTNSTRGTCP